MIQCTAEVYVVTPEDDDNVIPEQWERERGRLSDEVLVSEIVSHIYATQCHLHTLRPHAHRLHTFGRFLPLRAAVRVSCRDLLGPLPRRFVAPGGSRWTTRLASTDTETQL